MVILVNYMKGLKTYNAEKYTLIVTRVVCVISYINLYSNQIIIILDTSGTAYYDNGILECFAYVFINFKH